MTPRRSTIGYLVFGALIVAIAMNAAGVIAGRALDLVFLVSAGWVAFRGLEGYLGGGGAGAAAVALAGGLAALQSAVPSLRYTPYLLVVPINLALAFIFARGLMPRRRPVLLALIEVIGIAPAEDTRFRRFVAGQCALWSAMALGTAILAGAAMIHAPARAELSWALKALVAVQVLWFALSHHYATLRYHRPETWWDTLKTMARPDVWPRLVAR